jgi:hypothetical protein
LTKFALNLPDEKKPVPATGIKGILNSLHFNQSILDSKDQMIAKSNRVFGTQISHQVTITDRQTIVPTQDHLKLILQT